VDVGGAQDAECRYLASLIQEPPQTQRPRHSTDVQEVLPAAVEHVEHNQVLVDAIGRERGNALLIGCIKVIL
jgi:hypothetical protein